MCKLGSDIKIFSFTHIMQNLACFTKNVWNADHSLYIKMRRNMLYIERLFCKIQSMIMLIFNISQQENALHVINSKLRSTNV